VEDNHRENNHKKTHRWKVSKKEKLRDVVAHEG